MVIQGLNPYFYRDLTYKNISLKRFTSTDFIRTLGIWMNDSSNFHYSTRFTSTDFTETLDTCFFKFPLQCFHLQISSGFRRKIDKTCGIRLLQYLTLPFIILCLVKFILWTHFSSEIADFSYKIRIVSNFEKKLIFKKWVVKTAWNPFEFNLNMNCIYSAYPLAISIPKWKG